MEAQETHDREYSNETQHRYHQAEIVVLEIVVLEIVVLEIVVLEIVVLERQSIKIRPANLTRG